jgi:hypothetical protein
MNCDYDNGRPASRNFPSPPKSKLAPLAVSASGLDDVHVELSLQVILTAVAGILNHLEDVRRKNIR